MKKYIAPQMKVVKMNLQGVVLVGSWEYKFGVDPTFGDQGAFE